MLCSLSLSSSIGFDPRSSHGTRPRVFVDVNYGRRRRRSASSTSTSTEGLSGVFPQRPSKTKEKKKKPRKKKPAVSLWFGLLLRASHVWSLKSVPTFCECPFFCYQKKRESSNEIRWRFTRSSHGGCVFCLVSFYVHFTFGPLSLYPLFVSVPFLLKKSHHPMKFDDDSIISWWLCLLFGLLLRASHVWSLKLGAATLESRPFCETVWSLKFCTHYVECLFSP